MIGRLWHWGMGEMLSHPGLAFWLIPGKTCSSERFIFKICNILITTLLSSLSDKVIELKNKTYQVFIQFVKRTENALYFLDSLILE